VGALGTLGCNDALQRIQPFFGFKWIMVMNLICHRISTL
jgi:hypothetical protein